jgi:hypothetical protein
MESTGFLASISICKNETPNPINIMGSSNKIQFKVFLKDWILRNFSIVFETRCQKVVLWNHLSFKSSPKNQVLGKFVASLMKNARLISLLEPMNFLFITHTCKHQRLELFYEHLKLRVHILMNLNSLHMNFGPKARSHTSNCLWNLVICSFQTTSITFVLKDSNSSVFLSLG